MRNKEIKWISQNRNKYDESSDWSDDWSAFMTGSIQGHESMAFLMWYMIPKYDS